MMKTSLLLICVWTYTAVQGFEGWYTDRDSKICQSHGADCTSGYQCFSNNCNGSWYHHGYCESGTPNYGNPGWCCDTRHCNGHGVCMNNQCVSTSGFDVNNFMVYKGWGDCTGAEVMSTYTGPAECRAVCAATEGCVAVSTGSPCTLYSTLPSGTTNSWWDGYCNVNPLPMYHRVRSGHCANGWMRNYYKSHESECAMECLNDSSCTHFVYGSATSWHGVNCGLYNGSGCYDDKQFQAFSVYNVHRACDRRRRMEELVLDAEIETDAGIDGEETEGVQSANADSEINDGLKAVELLAEPEDDATGDAEENQLMPVLVNGDGSAPEDAVVQSVTDEAVTETTTEDAVTEDMETSLATEDADFNNADQDEDEYSTTMDDSDPSGEEMVGLSELDDLTDEAFTDLMKNIRRRVNRGCNARSFGTCHPWRVRTGRNAVSRGGDAPTFSSNAYYNFVQMLRAYGWHQGEGPVYYSNGGHPHIHLEFQRTGTSYQIIYLGITYGRPGGRGNIDVIRRGRFVPTAAINGFCDGASNAEVNSLAALNLILANMRYTD